MAQAETAAETGSGGLEEIVVTAQKREENLQDVPVAVTAIGAEKLRNLQVENFNDLSGLAPNLTAVNSGSGSNPIITLRGIVGGNVEPGKDNGVALYLDGVYISRSTGSQFDVADLERVEVLRGPQGTLYGRNSTGGAINYITAAPKGEFYARQETTVGSLALLRSKTRLDLPTFGAFSVSGTFLHEQRNGYVDNTQAGRVWNFSNLPGGYLQGSRQAVKRLGERNTEAGMLAVRFAPASIPLVADYKFDITDAYYSNFPKQVLFDVRYPLLTRNVPATMTRLDAIPMGFTTPEHLRVFGHNLTITLKPTDHLELKSITGYRGFTDDYSADVAGGAFENQVNPANPAQNYFAVLSIVAHERDRTFSQELQLNYSSDLFEATVGGFYFWQHTQTVNPLFTGQYLTPPTLPRPVLTTDADAHNKSIAAYGQGTFHLTDQLDVAGGIRYTEDTRRVGTQLTATTEFKAKFNHIDWMANLNFRPNKNSTLYAKVATGYLSGGTFNNQPFKPENLLQYEIGAKFDLFDRRLRANLAAFRSDYKNLQQSANNPNPPFLFQTFNVGKARIYGAEVELTAVPVDHLTLTANYGYTHFKYLEFIHPTFGNITNIASPIFWRPKHNLSFGMDYAAPEMASGIRPSVNVNVRWNSDQDFYFLSGEYRARLAGFTPALIAASRAADQFVHDNDAWRIDARATLAAIPMSGAKGKVSLWVRNLLDQRKINSAALNFPGFVAGAFMEPRTYGLDFSFEF